MRDEITRTRQIEKCSDTLAGRSHPQYHSIPLQPILLANEFCNLFLFLFVVRSIRLRFNLKRLFISSDALRMKNLLLGAARIIKIRLLKEYIKCNQLRVSEVCYCALIGSAAAAGPIFC